MPALLPSLGRAVMVAILVTACSSATSPSPTSSPSIDPSPTAGPTVRPTATPGAPTATEAALVAAGGRHSCAITSVGGVKCWGGNNYGQLGDGTTIDRSVPVDVAGLGAGVIGISAGGSHTCAITRDETVQCWGSNGSGQLGNGSATDSSLPIGVPDLERVGQISAGSSHTCAQSDGGVLCWGSNHYGQLGTGTATDSPRPTAVAGLSSGTTAVATGDIHSCAVVSDGGIKCWGYAGSGGTGAVTPTDVPGLASNNLDVAASYERTCALGTDGRVLCWDGSMIPADVFGGADVEARAISGGFAQTCALMSDASVWCWGAMNGGGVVQIDGLPDGATAIAAGSSHACALTAGGAIMCWGDNWNGQLGNGRTCDTLSSSPVAVPVDLGTPTGGEPTSVPLGRIVHATGPADVLLRVDRGPDVAVGDLEGELFQPGPEFTMYGDGSVIFRDADADLPPAEGAVLRAAAFTVARLNEDAVQDLLHFALEEGGLADACESYPTQDVDGGGGPIITAHVAGLDKRVEVGGPSPLGPVLERLLGYHPPSGVSTQIWVPDRYWGNLLDASIFEFIGDGLTPGLDEFGTVTWPWPDIEPADFVADEANGSYDRRRILSPDEAAVLGLSDKGGVVKRIYLVGPDGHTYYFSMWPVAPDETD